MAQSLLTRITAAADDPPDARANRSRAERRMDGDHWHEIDRYLRVLLAARAGDSQTRPDYGLTDLNDLAGANQDLTGAVARDIERAIAAFEPRLTATRAHPAGSGVGGEALRFEIHATIIATGERAVFRIDLARPRRPRT